MSGFTYAPSGPPPPVNARTIVFVTMAILVAAEMIELEKIQEILDRVDGAFLGRPVDNLTLAELVTLLRLADE